MKFNPLKARFRASFAAGITNEPRVENIDKENEVLHGVQITLEGEALGHDVYLDRAFCEAVVEAGNAMGDAGVKVRFGHPSACSDALGTYLGRAKNFRLVDLTRKDGTPAAGVLADVYIATESHSAPAGDLGKWVMEAAENSPDTFGQSIVFTYGDLKVRDAEGGEFLRSAYENEDEWIGHSSDGKVYAVLGKLHGTDFTDTPAATDGVFSADSLAAQAEELLAENPQLADVLENHPENVVEFLKRTNFWEKIESKRVAGMQAAKDKEIAELKAALETSAAEAKAALEAKEAEFAAAHQTDVEALAVAEAKLAEREAEFDKCAKAAVEVELAHKAEIDKLTEDFNRERTELAEKLASAEAEVIRLGEQVKTGEADLAACRDQFEALKDAHAMFTGGVLTPPTELSAEERSREAKKNWSSVMKAQSLKRRGGCKK